MLHPLAVAAEVAEDLRHEQLLRVERPHLARRRVPPWPPLARAAHLVPAVPPVDSDEDGDVGDCLQLAEQVVHRPQRHRELGKPLVPAEVLETRVRELRRIARRNCAELRGRGAHSSRENLRSMSPRLGSPPPGRA